MRRSEQQLDLAHYAQALEEERQTIEQANTARRKRRSFIVFATDPERVGEEDYKLVFACEARSQAHAESKVRRKVAGRRRVAAYLASGKYKDQLPEARWVA